MLTYRTGAAGSKSGGRAMANHLLEKTLPAEAAELARYYQNGLDALSPDERELRRLARAVAKGMLGFEDAAAPLIERRLSEMRAGDPAQREAMAVEQVTAQLRAAIEAYQRGAVEEPTTAEPRRDMHPRIAELLTIDPHRVVSSDELANLLSGQRADGKPIKGAAKNKVISFVDCCFSADKSVSLAWAFAPTDAERNQIMQAHRDAVESAMKYVSAELGRARKGAGGRNGAEAGPVAWVKFDHYNTPAARRLRSPTAITPSWWR